MNFHSFSFRIFPVVFATCLIGLASHSIAQSLGSAGAFMRMGIGARAGSMGDAYVAAASGPEAIYWNPAALAISPAWQVALTQRRYSFDRNFTFAGTTMPLGANHALGLGWTGFRTGGIEARQTNTTNPDDYFSDDENAFALMWGYHVNSWLYAGSGVKLVHQNLFNESAFGYSASLGFLIKPTPMLSFGGHWQDFISKYRWSSGRQEKFPKTFMLGMGLQFSPQYLVTVDYHYSSSQNVAQQNNGAFRVGSELRLVRVLPLRLGYSQNAFNTGLGFEIPVATSLVRLDYNFAVQDGLNKDGHALSLTVEFGRVKRSAQREGDSDFASRSGDNEMSSFSMLSSTNTDSLPLEASDAIKPTLPSTKKDENFGKQYVTATAKKVVVRSGPGASFKGLGMLRTGGRYEVARQQGEWYQIKFAGNKSGWVNREQIKRVVAKKLRVN